MYICIKILKLKKKNSKKSTDILCFFSLALKDLKNTNKPFMLNNVFMSFLDVYH